MILKKISDWRHLSQFGLLGLARLQPPTQAQEFAWIIKWRRHGVERRVRPLTTHRERQRSAEELGAIVAPIPNERSAMAFLDEIMDPRATHNKQLEGCSSFLVPITAEKEFVGVESKEVSL
ncbi:unnamed protein product [Urochloa humidicola]